MNIDISHLEGLKLGSDLDSAQEYAPDILIVPSRLKHFSKVSSAQVMLVNVLKFWMLCTASGQHNSYQSVFPSKECLFNFNLWGTWDVGREGTDQCRACQVKLK